MSNPQPLALECREVTVRYGAVEALDHVSLGFAAGRIHAVVGQNGAGKTTFARVCAGIVRPATGSVYVDGTRTTDGVRHARGAGVELVHQSFALPLSFSVAEAMEFGSTRPSSQLFSRRGLHARWKDHLARMGIAAPSDMRIGDLPIETQQAVEIARALANDARVLILDEPTAVLSPPNIQLLFERLRRLCQDGVTIVLILHRLHEVLRIAETVAVLRSGKLIAGPTARHDLDPGTLASAIIGIPPGNVRESGPDDSGARVRRNARPGAIESGTARHRAASVLELVEVRTSRSVEDHALDGVSISVEAGCIVGVAGVEGNGQRTLVSALAGLVGLESGHIRLGDEDLGARAPLQRRAAGLRIIPFDRNVDGLSLNTSLWENWSVNELLSGSLLRPVTPAALRSSCRAALQRWSVRFSTVDQHAGTLSGGNAQKLILAREINDDALLVVAAQPSRGLDLSATAFVWASLRSARERGRSVLLISSDLDELFGICDRIVVMLSGRIVGEFTPPYRLDAVGEAMTGARA